MHSPEPWEYDRFTLEVRDGNGDRVNLREHLQTITRAVNALAGLNPEAARGLIDAAEALRSKFRKRGSWAASCSTDFDELWAALEKVRLRL